MNYVLTSARKKYTVVETQTEQAIKSFKTQTEAKEVLRNLNLGGGFDGATPPFFVVSAHV